MVLNPREMIERWKDISGYECHYMISNYGNVMSLKSDKIMKKTMCKGYQHVGLWKNNKCKKFYIARLVALHFIPNPKSNRQVNHIDGDKLNNNYKNLEWVTAQENIKHAYDIGLMKGINGKDNPLYGRKASKETREKMRQAQLGNKHSLETIEKLCKSQKERWRIAKLENQ